MELAIYWQYYYKISLNIINPQYIDTCVDIQIDHCMKLIVHNKVEHHQKDAIPCFQSY